MTRQTLNQYRLRDFPPLFCSLAATGEVGLNGRFRAEFVGPAWLRSLAGPALALGGLKGWWGKTFDGQGNGMNLVRLDSDICPRLPVRLQQLPSRLDGQPTMTVVYPPTSPYPWPWIVDELRWLDAETMLGMTIVTKAGLHRFPFPFVLHVVD
ncbi:MAG: hypothetical protein R3E31_12505 [Chloroflexota bacterium]